MQLSIKELAVLGLVALADASPVHAPVQKRGVYKVERVANPNFGGHNGPRALLKTLQKYRMPVPDSVMNAVAKSEIEWVTKREAELLIFETKAKGKKNKATGTGAAAAAKATGAAKGSSNTTAAATNAAAANGTGVGKVTNTPVNGDVEYLSPVSIGGQTLNLDFDSGSSDLWVFNTQLSAAATTGHTAFDMTKSTSFKLMQGATFSISYGDGSGAAGNVGTDTVNIGGATVTAQAVELATAVSQSFVQDTANNGLVGLAFSKLNTVKPQQQKTFFDNVMPSLAQPLFTADLRANATGAYEFGAIDNTKFTGTMSWAAVNTTQGFWQFSSSKFAINGGAPQAGTAGGQAIADTGTTLILADPVAVQAYFSQIPGAANNAQVGGITVPCDAKLPDLQLDVGGTMATVKGQFINFAQVQGNTCFAGVQPSPTNLFIYGDIFFKSNFVVFQGGNNSLGVAPHA